MSLIMDLLTDETKEPLKKKSKLEIADNIDEFEKPKQQASLFNFFSASTKSKTKCTQEDTSSKETIDDEPKTNGTTHSPIDTTSKADDKKTKEISINTCVEAIVPQTVPSSAAMWQSLHDNFVLIRRPRLGSKSQIGSSEPRTKVAAFDLDGTLLQWLSESPGFWPSQLTHYELWNQKVISKMQELYDDQNYLLVIITNQGGIQGAHTGKKAGLLKSLVDWLESKVKRPLIVVASTKSTKKYKERSFHKPSPKLWTKVLVPYFGTRKNPLDPSASFFVGDSHDESDSQGGVDRKFAAHAGMKTFHTPEEYFGPSNQEIRQRRAQLGGGNDDETNFPIPPDSALQSRKALLGGYHVVDEEGNKSHRPILLILAGVQGSGKSTFCRHVLFGKQLEGNGSRDQAEDYSNIENNGWIWLCQDTINNGKPGKREKVEERAREALRQGQSVLLDRMHLDPEQREIMIENIVACTEDLNAAVQIHLVVLNPPKETIANRVRNRTNHPGKVEGDKGVRIALQSMGRLVMPTYEEGIGENRVNLISVACTGFTTKQLALRYHSTTNDLDLSTFQTLGSFPLASSLPSSSDPTLCIPSVTLGTMKTGRRICIETIQRMVSLGFVSIDTAPTYKNEDRIGEALHDTTREDVFLIAKVPKRATDAEKVREEFNKSLGELNTKFVDLLLLHWPSDVIEQGTLEEVWACMESFVKERKCRALGVCNFNEASLMKLLRCCSIPPVLNQVERHPLLPQFGLLDFCSKHNILLQAHTPLGGVQGKDEILSNPIVKEVSNETGLSPAQVLIRWNLQQGVLVVTKCIQESHANEILSCTNTERVHTEPPIALLSPKHMEALDQLSKDPKTTKRFVAPPFMYGSKNVYSWGERMPRYR